MAKQNLPPIEARLGLDDLPALTPQQEAAWSQVERAFSIVALEQRTPMPGFAVRWQARLAVETARRQRRYAWLMFLGTAAAALLLLLLLGLLALLIWQSPTQFFFTLLYRLALVVDVFGTAGVYLGTLLQALPDPSFVNLFFLNGFATLLCVLWYVAFQQLTGARRLIV